MGIKDTEDKGRELKRVEECRHERQEKWLESVRDGSAEVNGDRPGR